MPSECQREAARMLRLAQRDLKAALSMIDPDLFDEASWGFHLQQATEKALKAWIAFWTMTIQEPMIWLFSAG